MAEFEEISVTRVVKPLMKHSKKVRRIIKYSYEDEKCSYYKIYLKKGCVNSYDLNEMEYTTCPVEEDTKPEKIVALLDGWLDEIVMSDAVLKETIELGCKIEWLD